MRMVIFFMFISSIASAQDPIFVYRKFPNYKIITLGGLMGGIYGLLEYSLWKGGPSLPSCDKYVLRASLGSLTLFAFLNQLFNYSTRFQPVLIISEEGLWYDGIWFKRNIFLEWRDIKNISWQRADLNMDTFTI